MNKMQKKNAFTLIELLVVVAIIAALVGILSVAQRKVKIVSKNLRQKAALRAMEVGLALFSEDFDGYPDSQPISDGTTVVTGAQRLAEALLGRDELGFHPKSKWHPQLDINEPAPHPGLTTYTSQTKKDRKPQYVELRRSGVHTVYELWAGNNGSSTIHDSGAITPNGTYRAPVITDVFHLNKITLPSGENQKVGMPILYFKADSTRRFRVDSSNRQVTNPDPVEYNQWAYDFDDNLPVLDLPWLRDPTDPDKETGDVPPHYPDEDNDGDNHPQVFYELISRRHTPGSNWDKPYNLNTFILISAGYDGIYGTKDDLTNFDY